MKPPVPGAQGAPTPTVVEWSVADVKAAFEDLTMLLRGHPDGPFGYRAAIVRAVLDPYWSAATQQDEELRKSYQKTAPNDEGEEHPLPWIVNGREMELSFWCTDPAEFRLKLARLNSTVSKITFPVRFSYEEVMGYREPVRDVSGAVASWQGIRGAFWLNLYPLIDPPANMKDTKLPAPKPSIDPMLKGHGEHSTSDEE